MIVGLDYALSSVYSAMYIYYQFNVNEDKSLFKDQFYQQLSQGIINLCLDLILIFAVLFSNRKTIKIRKLIADKQEEMK